MPPTGTCVADSETQRPDRCNFRYPRRDHRRPRPLEPLAEPRVRERQSPKSMFYRASSLRLGIHPYFSSSWRYGCSVRQAVSIILTMSAMKDVLICRCDTQLSIVCPCMFSSEGPLSHARSLTWLQGQGQAQRQGLSLAGNPGTKCVNALRWGKIPRRFILGRHGHPSSTP